VPVGLMLYMNKKGHGVYQVKGVATGKLFNLTGTTII